MYVLPRPIFGSVSDTLYQPCLHKLEYVHTDALKAYSQTPDQNEVTLRVCRDHEVWCL